MAEPTTDAPPETAGQRLKRARMSLVLNQKKAAERIGVKPPTLCAWEKDKRAPSAFLAARVAEVFGVPVGMWPERKARGDA